MHFDVPTVAAFLAGLVLDGKWIARYLLSKLFSSIEWVFMSRIIEYEQTLIKRLTEWFHEKTAPKD